MKYISALNNLYKVDVPLNKLSHIKSIRFVLSKSYQ